MSHLRHVRKQIQGNRQTVADRLSGQSGTFFEDIRRRKLHFCFCGRTVRTRCNEEFVARLTEDFNYKKPPKTTDIPLCERQQVVFCDYQTDENILQIKTSLLPKVQHEDFRVSDIWLFPTSHSETRELSPCSYSEYSSLHM